MPYKTIVVIREVWDTRDLAGEILDQSGAVKETALATRVEPEDLNALETALQLQDAHGGKVTALSLGDVRQMDVLRECQYRGVDEVLRLSHPTLTQTDTLCAARMLAAAIQTLGGADLVLAGIDVVEGENALLGAYVAELLGVSYVSYVDALEDIGEGFVLCKRAIEGGNESVRAPLPALLTVGVALLKDDPRSPRTAKARLKLQHKKTDIPCRSAADLGLDSAQLAPLTAIACREPVPQREIVSKDIDPENEAALKAMLEELRADSVLR